MLSVSKDVVPSSLSHLLIAEGFSLPAFFILALMITRGGLQPPTAPPAILQEVEEPPMPRHFSCWLNTRAYPKMVGYRFWPDISQILKPEIRFSYIESRQIPAIESILSISHSLNLKRVSALNLSTDLLKNLVEIGTFNPISGQYSIFYVLALGGVGFSIWWTTQDHMLYYPLRDARIFLHPDSAILNYNHILLQQGEIGASLEAINSHISNFPFLTELFHNIHPAEFEQKQAICVALLISLSILMGYSPTELGPV